MQHKLLSFLYITRDKKQTTPGMLDKPFKYVATKAAVTSHKWCSALTYILQVFSLSKLSADYTTHIQGLRNVASYLQTASS